jgi:transposase InsO family protein
MNREVHVQFWEGAGLRCPALLAYLKAYQSAAEARQGIAYFDFHNLERLHQALDYRAPRQLFERIWSTHGSGAW